MKSSLHWNTVTPFLRKSLHTLMNSAPFNQFRLVGGTELSLQIGHRMSVDIDLFSDAEYGTLGFSTIYAFLKENFAYVDSPVNEVIGIGVSYFIGNNNHDNIKLDLYYTDPFFQSAKTIEGVRMASIEEIITMKIDIVQRGGRKKDFWDIHELLSKYSIDQMINLHEKRYPYSHDEKLILANFENADDDFDPICLRGKHWELIKLDILEAIRG